MPPLVHRPDHTANYMLANLAVFAGLVLLALGVVSNFPDHRPLAMAEAPVVDGPLTAVAMTMP